jgi:glutamine synthetase
MVENTWAPVSATWGVENRTTALRVIPGGEKSTRIEFRASAADMNPYIAMGTMLAAGLYGIEHALELPPVTRGNAYEAVADAKALPRSLGEATERLARSEIAREILGEEFVDHYVRTRQWEVRQYQRAVTDWELKRYFEVV